MANSRIWFYLVLFIAGSFAQHLGFWSWSGTIAKFAAVGFWKGLWAALKSVPGKLAELGGQKKPEAPAPAAGGAK